MNFDNDSIYKIILIVLLIIIVMQIFKVLKNDNRQTILENDVSKYENDVSKYENLINLNDMNENKYLKDNIYSTEKINNPILINTISTDNNIPCAPKFNWDVPHTAGANNTYGDMLWHSKSPNQVLTHNCLNCQKYQPGKTFNEPSGMSSDFTNNYDGTMGTNLILDDNYLIPELATGNKYMTNN